MNRLSNCCRETIFSSPSIRRSRSVLRTNNIYLEICESREFNRSSNSVHHEFETIFLSTIETFYACINNMLYVEIYKNHELNRLSNCGILRNFLEMIEKLSTNNIYKEICKSGDWIKDWIKVTRYGESMMKQNLCRYQSIIVKSGLWIVRLSHVQKCINKK